MAKATKTPAEERNWYKDRYQAVLLQRKLLAAFTTLSLFVTLLLAFYISSITPLIRIEPFVIQVDRKSGITETVNPATVRELTANESVNNFFIVQYIRARENYNIADLARSYNIVRIMSENTMVYPQFVSQADPNNPQSNAARFGSAGSRTARIKSITYLGPQQVQVRLLIEEKSGGGVTEINKVALIDFQYINLSLTPEERYVNPLGFRVTNYRLNDEAM